MCEPEYDWENILNKEIKRMATEHIQIVESCIQSWGIINPAEISRRVGRVYMAGDLDPFHEIWLLDSKIMMETFSEWKDNVFKFVVKYK